MNRLLVSAAALLFGALPAHAQSLVSGKVQTGTPSYTNDQNVPLSLDASGALKVTGGGSSGGSVTAPGTSGTQAQAVQGITGGVPLPIQGGNATAVKTDGSATTQPVSATSLPLPTGAATAANQATEISSLTAIAQRASIVTEGAGTAVAANATFNGTTRDVGAAPAYTRMNAAMYSSVAGTLLIQACQDSACGTSFIIASQSVSAGSSATVSGIIVTRYVRAVFANGGSAGNFSLSSSFTAN